MKSALMVIDVQVGLCSGAYAAFEIEEVIGRINQMSASARAAGCPVIYIQHEADDDLLVNGSAGWQLDPRLQVENRDIRLGKQTCDAFHGTALHAILQDHEISQLVICGLQTDYCVDTTVRRALALAYPVVLPVDAHSTIDNGVLSAAQIRAHHTRTLGSMESFGVRVTPLPAAEIDFSKLC